MNILKHVKCSSSFFSLIFFTNCAVGSPSLCTKTEEEIFGCKIESQNAKQVSLCIAKNNASNQPNYLAYRFGTKEKIEFEYPTELSNSSLKKFQYFKYRSTSLDNYSIFFENKKVEYLISRNSDINDGKQDSPEYSLDISMPSKKTIKINCQPDGVVDNLERTSDFLRCSAKNRELDKFCPK